MITLVAKAPSHQSPKFVFTEFNNDSGWTSTAYVTVVGLLQAQFTLTGYDSSAHMSEETKNAEIAGPVGMTMAVIGKDTFRIMQIKKKKLNFFIYSQFRDGFPVYHCIPVLYPRLSQYSKFFYRFSYYANYGGLCRQGWCDCHDGDAYYCLLAVWVC